MTTLVAAGLSYRTAPLDVRERAVVAGREGGQLLRYLVGHAGLSGAAVLSTCNRTELYLSCPDEEVVAQVLPRLARYLDPSEVSGISELMTMSVGRDAVGHMFRVAAGLESMVLGEGQVLGQFRAAHQLALGAGTLDDRLGFVMRRALTVGKRVRSETAIARGVGSLSEAAVIWAGQRLGSLSGRGVLLVGAGKMSALAARRLSSQGARLLVTSREGQSAAALAGSLQGSVVPTEELVEVAGSVDLIVCSTDSPSVVLRRRDIEAIQRRRQGRDLCIVDIAVPRDVEPAVATVAGVELVDVDGLGSSVAEKLAARRRCLPAAEAIVAEELQRTMTAIGERALAGPTIADLTGLAERLRSVELERTLARLPNLPAEQRGQLDQLTRSLVRKLLHRPISHLRQSAGDLGVVLTIRDAFDLDGQVARDSGRGRGRPRSGPD